MHLSGAAIFTEINHAVRRPNSDGLAGGACGGCDMVYFIFLPCQSPLHGFHTVMVDISHMAQVSRWDGCSCLLPHSPTLVYTVHLA